MSKVIQVAMATGDDGAHALALCDDGRLYWHPPAASPPGWRELALPPGCEPAGALATDVPVTDKRPAKRQTATMARGTRHWQSKLSDAAVREMRANAVLGPSVLARQYGISPGQACAVLKRRAWAHVADSPQETAQPTKH